MYRTLEIEGLNLERLLRLAAQEGVVLRHVRRMDGRTMRVRLHVQGQNVFLVLCARCGWQVREIRAGVLLRAVRFFSHRYMICAGLLLWVGLLYASSRLVLAVQVENAGVYTAEVRTFLREEGVRPGRLKRAFSVDTLKESLALRLPGLSFTGVRFSGSTLVVTCQNAREGERTGIDGLGNDIVALQPGIITYISVRSGTPKVHIGQAVHVGQVLISGEERTQGGEMRAVRAQGDVHARVFASAKAYVRLIRQHTVETGQVRTRMTLGTPWREWVLRDAQPFESQDVSVVTEPLMGLYLPVWRRVETWAETVIVQNPRSRADAASQAQGAAERLAKLKCPSDVEILDKWTEYSMMNDEFLYATVVLEYEDGIGSRLAAH